MGPDEIERVIQVHSFGLTEAEQDALFDRVADAAHSLDESVCCSGEAPAPDVGRE